MKIFDLRKICNSLITTLNQSIGKKSIIKLGIDIRLPNTYTTNPDKLLLVIHTLTNYLADHLINGIITIDIELQATVEASVTLSITVTGLGSSRNELNNLEIESLIASTGVNIIHKVREDQINFTFTCVLQSEFSTRHKAKLPFDGRSVLLVEDNEINALVFLSFLEEWGCKVITATNGAEAVSLVNDAVFDIILMDIHMPVMNGIEATRKIKINNPSIPIIVLTASSQAEDISEIMDAGAYDLLLKPVSSSNLFQVLSRYL